MLLSLYHKAKYIYRFVVGKLWQVRRFRGVQVCLSPAREPHDDVYNESIQLDLIQLVS